MLEHLWFVFYSMFTECLSSVLLIKCSICFATEPAGYVNEKCCV